MLSTEGIALEFTRDAIEQIADVAAVVNERRKHRGPEALHDHGNPGGGHFLRRPDLQEKEIVIDAEYVREKLEFIMEDEDLSRYVL